MSTPLAKLFQGTGALAIFFTAVALSAGVRDVSVMGT
jgi:hypothetical protein